MEKLEHITEKKEKEKREPYKVEVIFLSKKTQKLLFGHRSEKVDEPGTWSGFSGKFDENFDDGSDLTNIAKKKVKEQTGYNGLVLCVLLWESALDSFFKTKHIKHYIYLFIIEDEFIPKLNSEYDNFMWAGTWELPEPLHFETKEILKNSMEEIYKVYYGLTLMRSVPEPC